MEKHLKGFEGKRIEINCGPGAVYCGIVNSVTDDVVEVKEQDALILIAINKIISVTESAETAFRPGFIV